MPKRLKFLTLQKIFCMQVFKFGGASIKDAEAVKRAGEIVKANFSGNLLLVFSAMDKTTNALEEVCTTCKNNRDEGLRLFGDIIKTHLEICKELFNTNDAVFQSINMIQKEVELIITTKPTGNFEYFYDQVVPAGELLSSTIMSRYLACNDCANEWFDARDLIKTDYQFTKANVDKTKTLTQIKSKLLPFFNTPNRIAVTQGFISGADSLNPTTLGREGSDYSAALFAYFTNAVSVTIWKDVDGVLNADPKYFENTRLLKNISYREAIELAYYGASIIHPKTIQPLQEKKIPLFVKSFYRPGEPGSVINENTAQDDLVPSFIFRKNRRLISISPTDFSFVAETGLSRIFELLGKYGITVDIMQNSAINFSICVDDNHPNIEKLTEVLKKEYRILYNSNLELLTVRHYDQQTIDELTESKSVVLEQRTRNTTRMLLSDDIQNGAL